MPTIVHFEIPVDDVERARKFYSELFGWEIKEAAPGMGYWSISTGGKDSIGGGIVKRESISSGQRPLGMTNYVGVSSVDEYAAKVKKLGAKVVVPKMAVPGCGYLAICKDNEDNAFGLWEDNKNAR